MFSLAPPPPASDAGTGRVWRAGAVRQKGGSDVERNGQSRQGKGRARSPPSDAWSNFTPKSNDYSSSTGYKTGLAQRAVSSQKGGYKDAYGSNDGYNSSRESAKGGRESAKGGKVAGKGKSRDGLGKGRSYSVDASTSQSRWQQGKSQKQDWEARGWEKYGWDKESWKAHGWEDLGQKAKAHGWEDLEDGWGKGRRSRRNYDAPEDRPPKESAKPEQSSEESRAEKIRKTIETLDEQLVGAKDILKDLEDQASQLPSMQALEEETRKVRVDHDEATAFLGELSSEKAFKIQEINQRERSQGEELDVEIEALEDRMTNEVLTLSEEKQLIAEVAELRQRRSELDQADASKGEDGSPGVASLWEDLEVLTDEIKTQRQLKQILSKQYTDVLEQRQTLKNLEKQMQTMQMKHDEKSAARTCLHLELKALEEKLAREKAEEEERLQREAEEEALMKKEAEEEAARRKELAQKRAEERRIAEEERKQKLEAKKEMFRQVVEDRRKKKKVDVQETEDEEQQDERVERRTEEIKLEFVKNEGDAIGLDVDFGSGDSLMIKSVKDGLIKKWCDENDQQVGAGDFIVEVNGNRGNASLLLSTIKESKEFCLVIQRVVEVPLPEEPHVAAENDAAEDGSCPEGDGQVSHHFIGDADDADVECIAEAALIEKESASDLQQAKELPGLAGAPWQTLGAEEEVVAPSAEKAATTSEEFMIALSAQEASPVEVAPAEVLVEAPRQTLPEADLAGGGCPTVAAASPETADDAEAAIVAETGVVAEAALQPPLEGQVDGEVPPLAEGARIAEMERSVANLERMAEMESRLGSSANLESEDAELPPLAGRPAEMENESSRAAVPEALQLVPEESKPEPPSSGEGEAVQTAVSEESKAVDPVVPLEEVNRFATQPPENLSAEHE